MPSSGTSITTACSWSVDLEGGGAQREGPFVALGDDRVVQPAELELLPRPHVSGVVPIASSPWLIHEPVAMTDQKAVPFSPPFVSYRSGRPRSWPNSCAKTPRPPFSASIAKSPIQ